MANENNEQARSVRRQSWKPGPVLSTVRNIWIAVYSVLKIGLAALGIVTVIAVVCMLVFAGILGDYLESDIMKNADADLDSILLNQTSYVYYIDSAGNIQVLQKLHGDVKSEWVDYDDIPENLIKAAVAIEDKRFYEHQGVDWITTAKACINMFVGARGEFGGSSITQQLVKNYFGADDVTVQRKVLEIFRATELEKRYDKTVILEYYMNIIYLGQGCTGVKTAAATYFGKELEFLTPAECAALISITNNPSLYNPYRESLDNWGKTGMEQNKERRTNVLWMMRNEGYLTEDEYQEALNQELVLKKGIDEGDRVADCENEECLYHGKISTFEKREDGRYYCPVCGAITTIGEDTSQEVYSYFVDTVLEDLARAMAEKNGVEWNADTKSLYIELISRSGYHIYSTLDMTVQNQVDKIYQDLTQIPADYSLQQLQSGMVVIDNATGDIIAMAGGVGEKTVHDAWNRATDANLQPGSSFKPLTVYAPGFELGVINPATVVDDLPIYYADNRPYPYNDGRDYSYSRTILSAVRSSVNAVAVNTLDMLGQRYSFNFATEKFRISTLVKHYVNNNNTVFSDEGYSPLALGAPTFGVKLREMAAAYATFTNNGVYREARTYTKVYNSDGVLVFNNEQDSEKILSNKAVNYMNYCLSRAVLAGTGTEAILDNMSSAGKTGTTASAKDRWFCGFTPYYTATVWCGYDIPEVVNLVYGGNPSAQLWKKVMQPIHQGLPSQPLYSTEGMVEVAVCLDCGNLATDACRKDARYYNSNTSRIDYVYVYEEDAPTEDCDCHILVEFCQECNAVANEYCHKLAAVGEATIVERALVKKTKAEVEALTAASKNGLWAAHKANNYIYLVDKDGEPLDEYKGIDGKQNKKIDAPYLVCNEHTKKVWNKYLKDHPDYREPVPEEPQDPDQNPNDDANVPEGGSGAGPDDITDPEDQGTPDTPNNPQNSEDKPE